MNVYPLFIGLLAIFFIVPAIFLPFVLFFFAFTASILSIIGALIAKILMKRMFPVQLRIWEERYGSLTVVGTPRAVRQKHDQTDYYVTASGKKYRSPDHKYIVKGSNDAFCDIFVQKDESFGVKPSYDKDVLKSLKIVPDDNKFWLATQIEQNVAVTTPERSTLERMMPIMIVAVTGIILMVMIVSFMQYFPEFVRQTTSVMNAQITALSDTVDKFVVGMQASNQTVVHATPQVIPPPPG